MPTIPVYIRDEDYSKYLKVKESGWAEFVSQALNHSCSQSKTDLINAFTIEEEKPTPQPQPIQEQWKPSRPDPKTGYPCCVERKPNPETKVAPCRHWIRDDDGDYTNQYTGETVASE